MRQQIVTAAAALSLALMLSGCGGAAVVALGTVTSGLAIAKDVLDVDISLHSLLNGSKPEQPIPATALITNPEYLVVTPPAAPK